MVTAPSKTSSCCAQRNQARRRRRQRQRATIDKQPVCQFDAIKQACSSPDVANSPDLRSDICCDGRSLQEPQADCVRRCVKFNDSMCEVHQIMPYSEIYGIHPREFVFDKFYFMLPADGVTDVGVAWKRRNCIEEEEDSEGDSDEDLLADEWEYEYTM